MTDLVDARGVPIAPGDTAIIPLTKGYITVVDREDYADLARFNWHVLVGPHTAYARRDFTRDGRKVTEYMHSRILGEGFVDHENGLGLDNRRANLRPATHAQNMRNTRSRVGSSSRYLGVGWHKARGKWWARIQSGDARKSLGYYDSEEAAARAYDKAAFERDPAFCRLNFPQEYQI